MPSDHTLGQQTDDQSTNNSFNLVNNPTVRKAPGFKWVNAVELVVSSHQKMGTCTELSEISKKNGNIEIPLSRLGGIFPHAHKWLNPASFSSDWQALQGSKSFSCDFFPA